MIEENYTGLEDKREQLFKDMKKEFSNGSLMAAAIPVSCYKFKSLQFQLNSTPNKLYTRRVLQIKKDKKGKEVKVCTDVEFLLQLWVVFFRMFVGEQIFKKSIAFVATVL